MSFTPLSDVSESKDRERDDIAREPIRGGSLLLLGRLVSLAVMCAVQVLVVRHFSRTDYGAWTYALSVVTLLQSVAALGLDRSVTRFLAIYRERADLARVRGLVLLLVSVVAAFGTLVTSVLVAGPGGVGRLTGVDAHGLGVLCVVVFGWLDRGRIVSPAYSRLDPRHLERLQRRAHRRAAAEGAD